MSSLKSVCSVLLLLGCTAFQCCESECPRYHGEPEGPCGYRHYLLVAIGQYRSREAGMRSAIKHLAETRCRETQCIRVMWSGPTDDTSQTGAIAQALLYSRDESKSVLGYEHDFLSGTSGRSYFVDWAAIRAVADKGGTFEDFDQYDQKPLFGDNPHHVVSIGQFRSRDEGTRAAIMELAEDIQKYPLDSFRIIWSAPADDHSKTDVTEQALVCEDNWGDGQVRWLRYEASSHPAAAGRHYLVDRDAIVGLAGKGGTLEDFDQYDRAPSRLNKGGGAS